MTTYSDYGLPHVKGARKTWKHTLSPEKNAERIKQMQFCKLVRKELGSDYEITFYFNPGGPAVWGETYVKIQRVDSSGISVTGPVGITKTPVVEACLSHDFSYIRQWDGRNSGHNHPFNYRMKENVRGFVDLTKRLANQPFVRF